MMMILGLNEAIDHWVMVNSVHWSGYVMRRKGFHVWERARELWVRGRYGR